MQGKEKRSIRVCAMNVLMEGKAVRGKREGENREDKYPCLLVSNGFFVHYLINDGNKNCCPIICPAHG